MALALLDPPGWMCWNQPMTGRFLIYGANGYTGRLIAELAAARGLHPVLAGRDPVEIPDLGDELGLESEVFKLETQPIVEERLRDFDLVLHCAGPFLHTYRPVSKACLATGTHYLDITGEAAVFESLHRADHEAKEKGVLLMPGVGFDVVPSDCLARHLADRLPDADHLVLAIRALGRMSQGTAVTMLENLPRGGLIRKDGKLTAVPAAWKERDFDFGSGPVTAVTIPWGDLSTAYFNTGIPNIETYMALPSSRRLAMKVGRYLSPLLGTRPIQAFFKGRIRKGAAGPTAEQRARGKSIVWGEVSAPDGRRASARLETPDGYSFTAHAALAVVEHVLGAEEVPVGFQTPGRALGADFVLGLEGVERFDLD